MRLAAAFLLLPLWACAGPTGSSGSSGSGVDPRAALEQEMSSEGIYPEHRPSRVTLKDHRSGVTIGLLNEALTNTSAYYSTPRAQLVYKVIPDLDMGALLKQLEEFGFFQAAFPNEARVPGARSTVQVERAGQTFTLAYTTESDQKLVDRVINCSSAIQYVYNEHQAFQVIENPQGMQYFEEANRNATPPRGAP